MNLKEIKKQIYSSEDEKLVKFIREKFEQRGPLSKEEQEKNKCTYEDHINTLEKLDNRAINVGLARMAGIKENNNLSWISIPKAIAVLIITVLGSFFSSFIGAVLITQIKSIFNSEIINKSLVISELGGFAISSFIILLILLFIARDVTETIEKLKSKKTTSSYFTELLRGIKEDNKNNQE